MSEIRTRTLCPECPKSEQSHTEPKFVRFSAASENRTFGFRTLTVHNLSVGEYFYSSGVVNMGKGICIFAPLSSLRSGRPPLPPSPYYGPASIVFFQHYITDFASYRYLLLRALCYVFPQNCFSLCFIDHARVLVWICADHLKMLFLQVYAKVFK